MKIRLHIAPALIRAGLPYYLTQTLIVCGPDQMSAIQNKPFEAALVTDMMAIIFDQIKPLLNANVDKS